MRLPSNVNTLAPAIFIVFVPEVVNTKLSPLIITSSSTSISPPNICSVPLALMFPLEYNPLAVILPLAVMLPSISNIAVPLPTISKFPNEPVALALIFPLAVMCQKDERAKLDES